MKVDVGSLETVNDLTRSGARAAAESLSTLAGTNAHVSQTRLTLVDPRTLQQEFTGNAFAAVSQAYEGAFSGQVLLTFDRESAGVLGSLVTPDSVDDGDGVDRSSLSEVANILNSEFVDGWAEFIGEPLDVSTPTYIEHDARHLLGESVSSRRSVFVLESDIELVEEPVGLTVHVLPDPDDLERLFGTIAAPAPDETVEVESLRTFEHLVATGATDASDRLEELTGAPTDVAVSRVTLVPVADIPGRYGDQRHVALVFELGGGPGGYAAVVLDAESARAAAGLLLGSEVEEIDDIAESALEELGNVVSSGFFDSWANHLGTTIEISPPQYVDDSGPAILDAIAARVGADRDVAFAVDATIGTADDRVECDLLGFPSAGGFQDLLDALEATDSDELDTEPAAFAGLDDGDG